LISKLCGIRLREEYLSLNKEISELVNGHSSQILSVRDSVQDPTGYNESTDKVKGPELNALLLTSTVEVIRDVPGNFIGLVSILSWPSHEKPQTFEIC
jgi:hypothetical protein